ncbi:MAG TPA: helix-turn-helix transcriptional regulator [Magnetospirillaceae bacterium]|jgi:transcriptional regulator with XRE-family HTH domain
MPPVNDNPLGSYLKDRRTKLDPAAFGLAPTRRRTPGLRREEVAQRANVSVTWYTWLEQGRGGAPSADVLDRIAAALMLTEVEREHLFLLGLGRQPEVRYHVVESISPRLQRVLDSLEFSPAFVRTPTWDVIAWNRAAAAVLGDYGAVPFEQRNILRRVFCDPASRARMADREHSTRFLVAAFRADAARAGASKEIEALVDELSHASPEFASLWRENDVRHYGEGTKHLLHPSGGKIALEYSSFAVDGRPDLGMVIFNPATAADVALVKSLIDAYIASTVQQAAE